jgi:signal transduction histidine kinase
MISSDEHRQNDVPLILSRLKSIASSVMHAAEAETLGEVLERIADASRELVKARYAALGIPDGRGGLQFFEISGMAPELVPQMAHLPKGRGLIGAIMREREPIRLDDMQSDPRSVGFPANHPHMTRFLGVPILVGQQLFGQLYLCDREDGEPFADQDQWLLEMMAGYAALAIAGAQLREQQRRVDLLEERERIAMDLHDGVIQSIYAIGMYVDILRGSPQLKPDDLNPVVDNLNDVIEEIRSYIQDLKQRDQKRSIRNSLQSIIRHLCVPSSMTVEVEATDIPLPFPQPTYDAICQMANEAISNVVRHAQANHLRIAARLDDEIFQLRIADDGKGFNLAAMSSNHRGLGLRNIQQRAQLHGGHLNIDSTPGRGTTITLTIPVT